MQAARIRAIRSVLPFSATETAPSAISPETTIPPIAGRSGDDELKNRTKAAIVPSKIAAGTMPKWKPISPPITTDLLKRLRFCHASIILVKRVSGIEDTIPRRDPGTPRPLDAEVASPIDHQCRARNRSNRGGNRDVQFQAASVGNVHREVRIIRCRFGFSRSRHPVHGERDLTSHDLERDRAVRPDPGVWRRHREVYGAGRCGGNCGASTPWRHAARSGA